MKTQQSSKGKGFFATAFAATLVLAMAFTFNACSSDDNGSDGGSNSSCSINGNTVQIGNQTWMAENLNCNVSGSKCYGNNSSNCSKYGRLYTWEQAKSACPAGWHLPSDKEWKTLMDSTASDTVKTVVPDTIRVPGKKDTIVPDTIVSFIFGKASAKKLRAKSGWSRGGNGTDDYGFSILPGGYGNSGDYFYDDGYSSYSWSSSEHDSIYAYFLYYNNEDDVIMGSTNGNKKYYFSVRCVKPSTGEITNGGGGSFSDSTGKNSVGGGAQAYTDEAGTIKYTGSGELRFEPYGVGLSIPVGKIEDGIVKLQFPDTTIGDEYLESIDSVIYFLTRPECKDKFPADVKAISTSIFGYGSTPNGQMTIGYWDMVKGTEEEVEYLYSTGAANIRCNGEERDIDNITGTDTTYFTNTFDVNINIVKGWNEIYVNTQREPNSRGVKYSINKNILPNISKIKWLVKED